MLFETLESRQLLVNPGDVGTIWETYEGNYVPPQEFKTAVPNFLTAPNAGDKVQIAINYLKNKAVAFGALATDFEQHIVTDTYTDDDTGLTHVYFQQKFNGLPVADAVANVTLDSLGRVVSAGANFVRNLASSGPIMPVFPGIDAAVAVANVAGAMGRTVDNTQNATIVGGHSQKVIFNVGPGTTISSTPISAELHYVPKPGGGAELAWKVSARYPQAEHWFEASVGAQTGQRLGQVIRLTDWMNYAAYNVFPLPVDDPLDGVRRVEINPHSPQASPFGWHDINHFPGPEFLDLRGNNVTVQEDLNFDLDPSLGQRPTSQILEFDYFLFLNLPPINYLEASLTNLFYWTNLVHDISFHHGFTEVAGNFQIDNDSQRGRDADAVQAFGQIPIFNAFMGTPPDGQPPFLGMGISPLFLPFRDLSLDGAIITHEYTHGISNRLTGGPGNANALQSLQSGGMGEGWSDWLAMLLTINPGDTRDTPRTTGEWVFGPGGVRRFPYSFDLAVNPHTLNRFNGQDPVSGFPNSEVHNAGEIWAQALLDMSWLLIDRYGFDPDWYRGDGGNNLAIKLVLGGMKLQPANPSFLEARDAIVAADLALTGGANYEEIWTAFARRGFGLSADDGPSAASDVVSEAFDRPPPLSRVSGKVLEDVNNSGTVNSGDTPLAGWTIYVDANNNNQLDANERSTVSAADGSYVLPLGGQGQVRIRQVLQADWQRVLPSTGSYTVTVSPGSVFTGRNFLNRQDPGSIEGIKFNDLDASGTQDPGEPGIAGVMIYVDVNNDGRVGILEPSAVTDSQGRYRITNVRAGTNHVVREVPQPGLVQTFPDPADPLTLGGAHIGVTVAPSTVTSDINFGNTQSLDWGDAPDSYGTTLAANGPRHGIVTGYGLTLTPTIGIGVVDGEVDGQPSTSALGDDTSPALSVSDENGVMFLAGLTPGASGTVRVGVRTAGFSSGVLQAWIDFNRDGDFLDPGEQIIKDKALGTGLHNIQFAVPAGAQLGPTYARFRYGIERGIGPKGAALAGEVEDYLIDILQDQPIAVNDIFPDRTRVPPDPFIQLNSVDNPLNVLRNDFGTSTDPTPEIVATDFTGPNQTQTTAEGGTVRFQGPTLPLLYTPKPGLAGPDSFTYRVTAGGKISAPATVSLNVSPSNPIALDDIFRVAPGSTNLFLDILGNDLVAQGQTKLVKAGSLVPLTFPNSTTLTITPSQDGVRFTAPAGFTGTVRYQYTIDDNEPSTTDSSAIITIQVTAGDTTPAASHAAIFRTQYLAADAAGNPIPGAVNSINLENSQYFFVQFIVNDPAGSPVGLPETTGVESAYADFLIEQAGNLVEPVLTQAGRFDIIFNPLYTFARNDLTDFSQPGVLNEIGATHDPSAEPNPPAGAGNGEVVVMTMKFRALASGTVRVQADHADSPNQTILLFDPTIIDPLLPPVPIEIADEQVFIERAPQLTILGGGGEGEFTNFRNRYDVNVDDAVNVLDLLLVVNDLTLNGVRPLDQLSIAMSGAAPQGYLDTNVDQVVNVLDLLGIVNYITASYAAAGTSGASGEGEGETGEGEGAMLLAAGTSTGGSADLGGSIDPAEAALAVLAGEADEEPLDLVTPPSEELLVLQTTSASSGTPQAPLVDADEDELSIDEIGSSEQRVDSDAADELFSKLATFRKQLRARR